MLAVLMLMLSSQHTRASQNEHSIGNMSQIHVGHVMFRALQTYVLVSPDVYIYDPWVFNEERKTTLELGHIRARPQSVAQALFICCSS